MKKIRLLVAQSGSSAWEAQDYYPLCWSRDRLGHRSLVELAVIDMVMDWGLTATSKGCYLMNFHSKYLTSFRRYGYTLSPMRFGDYYLNLAELTLYIHSLQQKTMNSDLYKVYRLHLQLIGMNSLKMHQLTSDSSFHLIVTFPFQETWWNNSILQKNM